VTARRAAVRAVCARPLTSPLPGSLMTSWWQMTAVFSRPRAALRG
jgi:hypothetical protein